MPSKTAQSVMAQANENFAKNKPVVNQIYTLVNNVFEQMTGRKDISVVDTASLISMGRDINNQGLNDLWLNSVSRRIGLTIDSYRVYRNKFADLNRNAMEFGALVQKIDADMPEAVEDLTYKVGEMDGMSVDQWIISNPNVHQKFFDKETPYSFFITTQKTMIKEAFLSEAAMQAFFNNIFGKVQNKIEFVLEELARLAVANLIINMTPKQEINLVTMYNNTHPDSVTPLSCIFSPDFLRFSIGIMNNVADKMESMSILYNADERQKFTPKSYQRFYLLADYITQCETVVQYAAFHDQYVSKKPDIRIPYWQANKNIKDTVNFETVSEVQGTKQVENSINGVPATKKFCIGLLFDRDAVGTFRQEDDVQTTPINARARYFNTFWHEKQLWYNDLSENCVAFFLA